MSKKTLTKFSITESVCCPPGRIDADKGVIHDVKILGIESVNGRTYSPQALKEAAAHYSGMRVNLDHPEKTKIKSPRSVRDWVGQLESIQVREDGVYGDLHLLKTHPYTPSIMEAAERWPGKFGLSHNADCGGHSEGRRQVIESVDHVRSVDLVQRPATTEGLFEHIEESAMIRTTFRAILEQASAGKKGKKGLLKLLEMDGMADMGSTPVSLPAPADATTPDQTTSDDPIWDGVLSAINAVLADDSLDIPTTKAQIDSLLDHYANAPDMGTTPADDTSAAGSGSTTEGVDELRRELKAMKNEGRARDLLEQHDVQASSGRIKGVVAVLESASDLTDLLGSFPKRTAAKGGAQPTPNPAAAQKPRRSTPLIEGADDAGNRSALPYKDAKDLARMIR